MQLPDGTDDVDLTARARDHNIVIGAGRPYFITEPPRPHLRLSYAGMPEDQFGPAVQRLSGLL